MNLDDIRPRWQQILTCVMFYTRLPVSPFLKGKHDFESCQWAAPVAGLVVGLSGGLAFALGTYAGLAVSVAAAICLSATIAISGALHEDGVADTADGFGGGKSIEQKLQIMRDSRIGAYGSLALILSVLVRWSAITALAEPIAVLAALASAHTASRALIPAFMTQVPNVRSDGLSASVGATSTAQAIAAIVIGAVVLLFSGLTFVLTSVVLLSIWFISLKTLCIRQIGGRTGDTIGAFQQGNEVLILIAATVTII